MSAQRRWKKEQTRREQTEEERSQTVRSLLLFAVISLSLSLSLTPPLASVALRPFALLFMRYATVLRTAAAEHCAIVPMLVFLMSFTLFSSLYSFLSPVALLPAVLIVFLEISSVGPERHPASPPRPERAGTRTAWQRAVVAGLVQLRRPPFLRGLDKGGAEAQQKHSGKRERL